MIDLYTWPTPNGHKVQIMLEELALPYRTVPVDITEGAQFAPAFLAISPNNKVPTIVDSEGPGDAPYGVFETGAILLYLSEKTGRFMPRETAARYDALQWLMWQMGGQGPMFGQAQHFHSYAPEKVPYAMERYANEGRRLLGVMDARLGSRDYMMDEYSIVDMACFPWVRVHKMCGLTLDDFPNVARWYGVVRARPAVDRGLKVLMDRFKDIRTTESAKHNLFGDPQYERRST